MRRSFAARWVAVAALPFALGACDYFSALYGDTSAPPDDPPAPTALPASWHVDIGTGETSFVPLADGDTVAKTAGPQGGYHVWTSIRVDGDTPSLLEIEIAVTQEGALVSRSTSFVETGDAGDAGDVSADGTPERTIVGQRAFVDKTTVGTIVIGVKLIHPTTQAYASATRTVVLR